MTTTPVPHDHPDWQRTTSTVDIQVLDVSGVAQNVLQLDRGTFFVGTSPYLWLTSAVGAGGMRITLQWKDAQSGGNTVAVTPVDILTAMNGTGPIAVISPWVQILTDVDVVGRVVTLRIWQTYSQGADFRATLHNAMMAFDGANVNAGANFTFTSPNVRWGWGWWSAYMETTATWRIRLYAVDYLGNLQLLGHSLYTQPGVNAPFILPPRPIRVFAENTGAVAGQLYIAVYSHPGPV